MCPVGHRNSCELYLQAALEIIRGVRTFLRGRAGERRCGFVTLANPKEKPP
jgi:hypothetical protein